MSLCHPTKENGFLGEKILLVGDDLPLLATRIAVLAKTGADVVPRTPCELVMHLGSEKFDLVVLCQKLKETVRRSVIANAQRRWPQARILQDFTGFGANPAVEPGAGIATIAKPEKVIEHSAP